MAGAGLDDAGGGLPEFAALVLAWYEDAARDLPWRRPDATPWAV
ncbi:MAG: A/G-specific adenine glycosylase, partial [Jatrophihabitans endophyticus]|nr:A/G-specific adenine glycosylase [Jatrophihabitans endophyticus]